jgi:hypothetical protein
MQNLNGGVGPAPQVPEVPSKTQYQRAIIVFIANVCLDSRDVCWAS